MAIRLYVRSHALRSSSLLPLVRCHALKFDWEHASGEGIGEHLLPTPTDAIMGMWKKQHGKKGWRE